VTLTPHELAAAFPKLYHMTASANWPSIQRFGLLSTCALMDTWEVREADRPPILEQIRRTSVTLNHEVFGEALIRDQKPMTERGLTGSRRDGLQPRERLRLLNGLVFFWTRRDRLEGLLNAREYRGGSHVVLEVDTLALVTHYFESVLLTTMNTGSTQRSHPRGRNTFRSLRDVARGDRSRIVEVCVPYAVPDISQTTLRVIQMPNEER